MMIEKIVSGGQTGADRAGLDVAIWHEFPYGGWCPKGRRAEDGPIPDTYQLTESPSANYLQRTEWNVRDSDGTVIFTMSQKLTGGSKRTSDFANKLGKPWIHLFPGCSYRPEKDLIRFVEDNQIRVLNVAGSRGSKEPDLHGWVKRMLTDSFFWNFRGDPVLGGPDEG